MKLDTLKYFEANTSMLGSRLANPWVLETDHALTGHSNKNSLHNRARPDGATALVAFRVGWACIGLEPACCPNVRHKMHKESAKGIVSLFGMEEQARHGGLLRLGRKSKLLGASVELGSLCGTL